MKQIELPLCVIDDDPSLREAVAKLLRSEGLTVEIFASPEELLLAVRESLYDHSVAFTSLHVI